MNNSTFSVAPNYHCNKLVSIIIVNFNGKKWLEECLNSLGKQNYRNIEIILVDNASVDDSVVWVMATYPQVKIVNNKSNVGFATGNNIGFQYSTGEYILLLNNDTYVDPDFLISLVGYLENHVEVGIVQPKIYLATKDRVFDSIGSIFTRTGFLTHYGLCEKDSGQFNRCQEFFAAKGACMLIKRELIIKVGLFDDDFFAYFEEVDFCWRSWLAGYRTVFVPDSVIFHYCGKTSRWFYLSMINYHSFKNRICALIKNLESKNILLVMPVHLLIVLGIAISFLCLFQVRNFWAIIKALIWNIFNLMGTLQKRKVVQRQIRKRTDKEIFSVVGGNVRFFSDLVTTVKYLTRKMKLND